MSRYAGIGAGSNKVAKIRSNNYGTGRGLSGKSRTQERIDNKLGRISADEMGRSFKRVRCEELDRFDKYLCNEQYDNLLPWDSGDAETYIPIRKRKPRIIFNLGKRVVDTVASKLTGKAVFPAFTVEDDPETEQFLRMVMQASNLQIHILGALRKALGCGSSFLRFYIIGSRIRLEVYDSKYCYPTFDDENQLISLEVRYVYADEEDKDERGKPREKWFRMILGTETDVLYDNPLFVAGSTAPVFQEVASADHMFGFVQGQWFRTSEDKHKPDGISLIDCCTDLIDAINYSLSQGDQALAYAQEPQLALSGMDVDEIDNLIKSSEKAWNLGREGEAKFVEADLGGVEKGMEMRDKYKQHLTDVARVVMLEPEKIVGSAQSAKAMEVLHGPLVELIDELRQFVGPAILELLTKIAVAILKLESQGQNEVITMPKGWQPKSLNVTTSWPEIFPMTMEDLLKKVQVGVQAANATIVSRESITRWLVKDFGIENLDEELAKLKAQPVLNPFGAF